MAQYNTPLRYPGGKQRLAPFITEIIEANDLRGGAYIEPYAGGAGVALELLTKGVVSDVHLNDISKPLFAFWRSVLNQTDELCERIVSASMTVDEWKKQKAILTTYNRHNQIDVAFSLLYLNRCNRSGILSGGVIGGLNQSGNWKMDARFPTNELVRRIERIGSLRNRITVTSIDADEFLTSNVNSFPKKSLIYCDPPYYNKADRLYLNHYKPADHKTLANTIQSLVRIPWIVSYDSTPEVLELYSKRRHFEYSLQYNAGKAYKGREVFIFSDKMSIPTTSTLHYINNELDSVCL